VDVLVLRLEAPLMSFGGVAVDERRPTLEFPGRSLLTGLLGNALGWHHRQAELLQRLQDRLDYAVRQDLPGQLLQDFHTVDLGQDFLLQGWTTHGRPETRGKGSATSGTHIRRLDYLAGAAYTVALTLAEPQEAPTVEELERALHRPARPLFLGRKTCLPSRPLVGHRGEPDRLAAASPLAALAQVPPWARRPRPAPWQQPQEPSSSFRVWWPAAAGASPDEELPTAVRFDRTLPLYDERDWHHQFHAGRRFVCEGRLHLATDPEAAHG
jgi:CRISPR system Cascade subunit CasD